MQLAGGLEGEDSQELLPPLPDHRLPKSPAPLDRWNVEFNDAELQIYEPGSPMRRAFARAGIATTFPRVNLARVRLTTTSFPSLRAC